MEVTKFDTLEELTGKFRLEQLLWDCLDEWGSLLDGWRQVRSPFTDSLRVYHA